MKPNETWRPSSYAWAGLAAGVLVYDVLCPLGETLSEGADRALERRPLLTVALIGTTALHLANLLPEQIDPFHHFVKLARKV